MFYGVGSVLKKPQLENLEIGVPVDVDKNNRGQEKKSIQHCSCVVGKLCGKPTVFIKAIHLSVWRS